MSYTTILAITPGESVEHIAELRNSWDSAILIWDAIWNAYSDKRHEYDSSLTAGDRLWGLYDDPRLSESDRVVFAMTFDRWFVAKKDYARIAKDIGKFMSHHNVGGHWMAIRDLFLSNPDHAGIGFWWTSVAENPFNGEWDEEAEEYGPPDWDRVYSLYDQIDADAAALRATDDAGGDHG